MTATSKLIFFLSALTFWGISTASPIATKEITFDEITLYIPKSWHVQITKDNCLYLSPKKEVKNISLIACHQKISKSENDFFKQNENGKWEAQGEGMPIETEAILLPQGTYLRAVVSCRVQDESGAHLDECLVATLLSSSEKLIFIGKGNRDYFPKFETIIRSSKIKNPKRNS